MNTSNCSIFVILYIISFYFKIGCKNTLKYNSLQILTYSKFFGKSYKTFDSKQLSGISYQESAIRNQLSVNSNQLSGNRYQESAISLFDGDWNPKPVCLR